MRKTLEEKIWEKVAPADGNGCRRWLGKTTKWGSPIIGVHARWVSVRRALWEAEHGPLSSAFIVVADCNTPLCTSHIIVSTRGQDALRRASPLARHAVQQFCHRGHQFTLENTYIEPNGRRHCKKCLRAYWKGVRVSDPERYAKFRSWGQAYQNAYRAARVAAHLCIDCGAPSLATYRCDRCKERARTALLARRAAQTAAD
jgi:hypothetical protein